MYLKGKNERLDYYVNDIIDGYRNSGNLFFDEFNVAISKLFRSLDSCKDILLNHETLSDLDFYNRLSDFMDIRLDYWDYYHIVEKAYDIKFKGEATLPTTMHKIVTKTEGQGRTFDYWTEEIGVDLIVFYQKDFLIESNHVYSVDELHQLISDKKIVVVSEEERDLCMDCDFYNVEDYKKFDIIFDNYSREDMQFSEKEKFFPYTINYIREQVNIKNLEEKYCFLLHSTFYDLYNSLIDFRDNYYYSVIEQFNMENHDNNYSKILNRLNSLRNSKY